MDKRYEVVAFNGKGVFSVVVRARDLGRPKDAAGQHPEVAIKLIRCGTARGARTHHHTASCLLTARSRDTFPLARWDQDGAPPAALAPPVLARLV